MHVKNEILICEPAREEISVIGKERTHFSSASQVDQRQWSRKMFGNFECTDAIRPRATKGVRPTEGWKIETYQEAIDDKKVGELLRIVASVNRSKIFDVLSSIIKHPSFGECVGVTIDSDHYSYGSSSNPVDPGRVVDAMEAHLPLVLDEGVIDITIMGVGVESPTVILDDHKLLLIEGYNDAIKNILEKAGISDDPYMFCINEGRHMHKTDEEFEDEANDLIRALNRH